jgi:hypothetical protein
MPGVRLQSHLFAIWPYCSRASQFHLPEILYAWPTLSNMIHNIGTNLHPRLCDQS